MARSRVLGLPAALAASIVAIMLLVPAVGAADTVRIPMRLDFQLLHALFVQKLYTAPGQRAVALDADQGCTRIELWEPQLAPEGRYVRLTNRVTLRAGVPWGEQCLQGVSWEGYIEVVQRPYVDPRTWSLRFETIDSRVYDSDHKRSKLAKALWNLVKTDLHNYLNRVWFDISPPVDEIQAMLPSFFGNEDRNRVFRWMESIRPGRVSVDQEAVWAEILMEVEPGGAAGAGEPERDLTQEELDRFVELWESWDAFLIHQIKAVAGEPLTEDEKKIIFDTVIETRHNFIKSLMTRRPGKDLVRRQFIYAWENLAPIFRKYLGQGSSPSLFSYLAFFTAADALTALDRLGPTLGLEISRNGLIRMARLMAQGEELPLLSYDYEVDPQLRAAMGLEPAPEESGPSFLDESLPDEDQAASGGSPSWLGRLADWLAPPALAASSSGSKLAQIRQWLVTRENLDEYLPKVRRLLAEEAEKVLAGSSLDPSYQDLYRVMIQAICWQETCFRQFKVNRGKVRYLRSYDTSSVGLMQINERVWRKLYNRNSLRWDIRYNAAAGCRIMARYLRRYVIPALERKGEELDDDVLARVCYAMYNGGPSQLAKFMKRHDRAKYYRSDVLFYEKLIWAKFGEWDKVSICLFGD